MVFCNMSILILHMMEKVTILILVDGFLQYNMDLILKKLMTVTILILVDGFLQYKHRTIDIGEQ